MASDTGIKQLGKNRWLVRVKQVEKRTGRMVNRKQTVTGSKADAVRVRAEICAELKSTALARPRIRLREFAASWLEQREPTLKPSVSRKYGYGLLHIDPVLGDLFVDSITPADVSAYVAHRIANVGVKGGNTVLNELRLLRTIAKDSVAEGYAHRYWCDRVKPPKVRRYSKERPNLLTAPQFKQLIEHIPTQWRGLVLFMATTGLRWGEASALHWQDVDLETGEASIRHGNYRGELVAVKTEGSNRVVPVLADVAKLWGLPRARGPVFVTRHGRLHKGTPLIKVLTKACAKAGVPRITPHGLRRTFNNLARQKASREVLKSITGHSTDAMVEHYSLVGHDEKTVVSRSVATSIGVPEVSQDPIE
jgi:integrase